MRSKKAFKNVMWGFIYQISAMVCGFILPRLVLQSFGSDYNGITNTIKQFLQVISLFQAGLGGVTMAALYKPLAEKDRTQMSVVIKTTETHLRKIAMMFIGIALVVACILPLIVHEFNFLFTSSLVMIMSLSTFVQYFFGLTYQYLLNADQCQRFMLAINTGKVIANTALSALLIKCGFGIHAVQLGAAVVFLIAPIILYIYVNKRYDIDKTVKPDNAVIPQRWDNFGMEACNFININVPLTVLAVFATMKISSIYTTYNLVIAGVMGMFTPFITGIPAAFGDMFAKNEQKALNKNLRIFEQVVFAVATFLFGVTASIIVPFVELYTKKAKDVSEVNYIQPLFALLFTAAALFQSFRYPYSGITQAAGHFKQNRNMSFVEAAINISVSTVCTWQFGLIGVAIGSLCAYAFRTIRFAIYVSKNLIIRSNWFFIKRIITSVFLVAAIASSSYVLPLSKPTSVLAWMINACILTAIAFVLVLSAEFVLYHDDLMILINMIKNVLGKNKNTKINEVKTNE